MATTNIMPIYDFGGLEEYVTHGTGDVAKEHREQGTDRVVYRISSDTPENLPRYARRMCKKKNRTVEGQHVRISFSKEDLDPNDPNAPETAAGLAYDIISEQFPNALCDIVIHDDGKGGNLHAHCLVVNQDEVTGRALRNTSHKHVSLAADRVCKRNGYSVVGEHASRTWEQTCSNGKLSSFEMQLGDTINECLQQANSVDEFKTLLIENGVELRENKNGWSYSMLDTTDPNKERRRRRKASSLCSDFTRNEVERRFNEQVYPLSPELQEYEDKLHDEQASKRSKTLSKSEEYTPNERDERTLKVDAYETRMDACAIASHASKNKQPNLYQEMRERIDKNGADAFRKEMEQMQRETERAEKAFHRAKEQGRKVNASRANVVQHAAQTVMRDATKKGDTAAIIVSILLMMWAERERQIQRIRQEMQKRHLYDKRAEMWTAEKRSRAAETVMKQYTQDVKRDKQLKIEVAQQTPQTQQQTSRGMQSAFSAPRQREHTATMAPGGGLSHDRSL
ncbi:Relaxase/Mobilisation nuclease domain [Slackia heliotrinireducens]|nr:relaxase/mobilization nuclease domain-containing protein [Slackia heliotrinireducens]VEH01969.1 Relaxase/Mobilisation nuclease domain [Slackia heliotrinireducens]